MAKFLNTSGVTYHLEQLIKCASDRLILISPYLRLNDRIRELLEDKDRLKLDVRLIYGKNELQPDEISWLRRLNFVRTSFCKNLHAKCYLNESQAIITSMNLYEFSQVNNNEMGVLLERETDGQLYRDAYEEAQRLIRISDEIKITVEKVAPEGKDKPAAKASPPAPAPAPANEANDSSDHEVLNHMRLISTTKLSQQLGMKSKDLFAKFQSLGWIKRESGEWKLLEAGRIKGGTIRSDPKYNDCIVWPSTLKIDE